MEIHQIHLHLFQPATVLFPIAKRKIPAFPSRRFFFFASLQTFYPSVMWWGLSGVMRVGGPEKFTCISGSAI